jgi:SH3-like domain-containing protein
MRKFQSSLIACCSLGLLVSLWSCQVDKPNATSIGLRPVNGIYVDTVQAPDANASYAICIYDKAGLRKEPTQRRYNSEGKENYMETIRYGEIVEYLGETEIVERERTTYIKVRLQDDQEGWAFEYAFEQNAQRGAMIQSSPLYRRPDLMTLRDDTLKPGEIVAVIQRQGDWLQVSGRNKGKKGWIQVRDNVSLREKDVYIALLYHKAKEPPESTRVERLSNVLDDPQASGSLLKGLVEQNLTVLKEKQAKEKEESENTAKAEESVMHQKPNEGGEKNELTDASAQEKLQITAPEVSIHSSPEEAENPASVLGVLVQGSVCNVLQQGERTTFGNADDYWYQVEHQGKEGWVFGSQTSLRLLN